MNVSQLLTRKLLLVSIIAIIGIVFLYSKTPSSEIKIQEIDNIVYEVDHPFTTEATNLLKTNSTTDKLESRLNKYDIKYALDEVLLSEGFDIDSDITINRAGVNIPVSTFDRKTNIGYLLLDYDRLGEGLSDEKLSKTKTLKQCEIDFLNLIDQGVELYFDDEEKFLDDVFGKVGEDHDKPTYEELRDSHFKTYQEALDSGVDRYKAIKVYSEAMADIRPQFLIYDSVLDDWNFYGKNKRSKSELVKLYGEEIRTQLKSFSTYGNQREYLELVLQEFKKKLEVEELTSKESKSLFDEWKLSAAEMLEEPDRFFGFANMIDNIRLYRPTQVLTKRFNEQIIEIVIETDSKKWWNRSKAIFALFNVNEDPGLFSKQSYKTLLADILSNKNYKDWVERYDEIKELSDKENISLKELNSLNRLAIKNGIFIAPISILDDRMIYDMEEEKYLASLSSLRTQIAESKSKSERIELQKELLELSQYRATEYSKIRQEAKAISITKLQADMCDYIQWAKNQIDDQKLRKNA
jgi:hypothetical protein